MDRCPLVEDLLRADADPAFRDRLLVHAAHCQDCQEWLEILEERRAFARIAWRERLPWAVVAAAVLLAAMGAALVFRKPVSPSEPAIYVLPQGEKLGVFSGEFAAGSDAQRCLELPDASRLRLEPSARIRFLGPREVQLLDGAVEADVVPGRKPFLIRAVGGEIRVLGTHLRVKTFVLPPGAPSLCVEVYTGAVLLQGSEGNLRIQAGERGVIAGPRIPAKHRMGQDADALLRSLTALLSAESGEGMTSSDRMEKARLVAGFLLGGKWSVPLDLRESAADSPGIRGAKRWLAKGEIR